MFGFPISNRIALTAKLSMGALLIASCTQMSPEASGEAASDFKLIGSMGSQYFVVAASDTMRNRERVREYAQSRCVGVGVCFVHFWTSEESAGSSLPLTDAQAGSVVASYNINRNTGNDEFQCYNFGQDGEKCY